MLSLEPLAQDPRNEIMNLCRVNQFTLFLYLVLPYPGPETCLVEGTLVWLSEQFTLPEFGLGLVAKCDSANTQARPKGSVLAPCVTLMLLVDRSCSFGTEAYFLCQSEVYGLTL